MKKIVLLLMVVMGSLVSLPVSAGVQDFHFSDFTADYYLSKDEEGISHLKVVESVTAVFPYNKQNKGICRQIAYTNQNGANITLPNLTQANIKVTRNGVAEPIYRIEKDSGYYNVCTGTDEYVLGTQVYGFEYEFDKVVTDFGDYQELYWDTNGNGATQKFNKVTARVHLADENWWTGESWCYVGSYGESGQDRCKMMELEDGVEFMAARLSAYENLTFDIELKPGSFVVPEPEKNYTYVWMLVGLIAICVVVILLAARKFIKTRDKARYYKGLFVKPEYQPNTEYSLPEMAEIYIGKKKDAKVAMLLELVVKRKIELVKGEKKRWNINVKNLDGVGAEYVDLLSILNGGMQVKVGDMIELKSYTASSKLIALKKAMEKKVVDDLEKDGLATNKWHYGIRSGGFLNAVALTIVVAPVMITIGVLVLSMLDGALGLGGTYGGIMVFAGFFYQTAFW